jgi:phosphoglycerate dehydrogenase-like enzyme
MLSSDSAEMTPQVLCLRPEADFARVGVTPPRNLAITYTSPDDAALATLIGRSDGMVIPAVGPKLNPDLFRDSQLKLVQVTGAGTDRLDLGALQRLGIAVANVPGGSNDALAEYVLATSLVLLRRFSWATAELRKDQYKTFRASMVADNLPGLRDMLVGIIGFGTVGSAVAGAFRAMGSRICYFDPAAKGNVSATDARSVSLDELLATADVITVHVPLLPSTRNLIGANELAKMKPGAVLVDASRGGVVDQSALADTLRAGRLGGAAVDVYSEEPPPSDHPLLTLEGEGAARLLLTPHIAGVTRQASAFLFQTAWGNIERVLVNGQDPRHRVN